jgi:hypothetical protein
MIINNAEQPLIDSNGLKSEKFSIKFDAKMFKLLSDTLYNNKEGSIVRELSCNALDSHRSAGRGDMPFEIHLPSVYEPWFSVKDFGLGMSEETMNRVFREYGNSTKDQSNDSIGGFGLGAKTPLAYTDTFTVTSVHGGTKSFYTVIPGSDGIPMLTKFGEEETDEHNGVEVKFSVREDDYRGFANEVLRQLRFFIVKPTLLNNAYNIQFSTIEYDQDFGNFKTTKNLGGLWVVQGEVGYQLDKAQFTSKIKDKKNLEFFNLYSDAVMFFEIGKVEVVMSREAVSYSEYTVNSLEAFVAEHAPIIYKNLLDQINSFTNDWQRISFLNESQERRRFMHLADMKLGIDGNCGDQKVNVFQSGNSSIKLDLTKTWRTSPTTANPQGKLKFLIASFNRAKNNSRNYFNSNELYITPGNDIRLYVRDTAKTAIGKMKREVDTNYNSTVYLIEHPEGSDKVTDSWVQMIQELFAGAPVTRVSALPELPKNYTDGGRKAPVVVYEHNKKSSFSYSSIYNWHRIYDEEEIESGYYLTYDKFPYIDAKDADLELVNKVFSAGMFDKPIFVIKNTKRALLDDNPNFSCPIKKAKEMIQAMEKEIMESELMVSRFKFATAVRNTLKNTIGSAETSLLKHEDILRLPKDALPRRVNRMHKIAAKYLSRVNRKIDSEQNKIKKVLLKEKLDMELSKEYEKVNTFHDDAMVTSFYDAYPMIRETNRNHLYDSEAEQRRSKNLVDYILMVDKLNVTQ